MVFYDQETMRKHAEKLQQKADIAIIKWICIGFVAGFFFIGIADSSGGGGSEDSLCMFAIIGAIIGLGVGVSKSNDLKARSQEMLCLIEMENHLRWLSDRTRHAGADHPYSLVGPPRVPGTSIHHPEVTPPIFPGMVIPPNGIPTSNRIAPPTVSSRNVCPICFHYILWNAKNQMWWCRHCRKWMPPQQQEPERPASTEDPELMTEDSLGVEEELVEEEVVQEDAVQKELMEESDVWGRQESEFAPKEDQPSEAETGAGEQEPLEGLEMPESGEDVPSMDPPPPPRPPLPPPRESTQRQGPLPPPQEYAPQPLPQPHPRPSPSLPPVSRDTFPRIVQCPYCSGEVRVMTIGNFICGHCAQIGRIDEYGIVERE